MERTSQSLGRSTVAGTVPQNRLALVLLRGHLVCRDGIHQCRIQDLRMRRHKLGRAQSRQVVKDASRAWLLLATENLVEARVPASRVGSFGSKALFQVPCPDVQ